MDKLDANMKHQVAKWYIFCVFLLIPIYYENGYFNTLAAKAHIYYVCAASALIIAVIFWGIGKLEIAAGQMSKETWSTTTFNTLDAAVAAFGIAAVLSWLFSDYGMDAFTGNNGWHMGAFTLATLSLTYFMISRYFQPVKQIWVVFSAGTLILYTLGFLNGLNIDPLSLHTQLLEKEHFEYISTVGNVNSFAGYLSLTIPIVSMLFVYAPKLWEKVILWFLMALGFANMYMANSDGAWVGAGFAYLFFVHFFLRDKKYYKSLLWVGLGFCFASLAVKFCQVFGPDYMVEFQGLPKKFLTYQFYLPIGLICLVLLLGYGQIEGHLTDRLVHNIQKGFMIFGIAAVVAVFGYNALIFDGRWGTKRGWIWVMSFKLYYRSPLKEKIIGYGPDCLAEPLNNMFGDFLKEKWGKRVANAHNEYIQYLLTMGFAGMLAYVGMYFASFREYLRKKKDKDSAWKAAMFFGIIGYAGQAVVNNPQAMNMAILFVLMGLLRCDAKPNRALQKKPLFRYNKNDAK